MSNPYVPPSSKEFLRTDAIDSEPGLIQTIWHIFSCWEALRVLYIAFLGMVTYAMVGNAILSSRYFPDIALGAVVANICFCAGPVVEFIAHRYGHKTQLLRWTLFFLGTIFASILAVLSLAEL